MTSRAQRVAGWRRPLAVAGIALLLLGNYALAQNLGAARRPTSRSRARRERSRKERS
jgi:hypothetical protein